MLLIDAANVIGSRPTGWWRDRPAAARDLVERVTVAVAARTLADPVVVVLEGAARDGFAAGELDGVSVVHAARSGDDALVELADASVSAGPDHPVLVVTADRALRRRLEESGAEVVGPTWLLSRLDPRS
jgi:rRNA-processing protein FCF1